MADPSVQRARAWLERMPFSLRLLTLLLFLAEAMEDAFGTEAATCFENDLRAASRKLGQLSDVRLNDATSEWTWWKSTPSSQNKGERVDARPMKQPLLSKDELARLKEIEEYIGEHSGPTHQRIRRFVAQRCMVGIVPIDMYSKFHGWIMNDLKSGTYCPRCGATETHAPDCSWENREKVEKGQVN